MSTEKPSASAVSRALATGGMIKSTTHTTRIKGWTESAAGFRVTTWKDDDYVNVEWINGHFSRDDNSAVEMARATVILEGKGYGIEAYEAGRRTSLKVRKAATLAGHAEVNAEVKP